MTVERGSTQPRTGRPLRVEHRNTGRLGRRRCTAARGFLRIELSAEFFNLFNLDNVVFASSFGDDAYGLGIDAKSGATIPPRSDFMRLRLEDGPYDTRNRQIGGPFQAQFGARFFF